MQENSRILRIGGNVGFDFMNTNYKWGERVEVLDSPEALIFWMIDSHLITEKDVKIIKQRFSSNDLNRLLTDALDLRARLRVFVTEFKEKGASNVSKQDLQYLNNILRRGSTHLQVEVHGDHVHMHRAHEWNSVEEVLALIVESVMETLSTEDFDLIKRCENPVCPIWFVDNTKAHKRKFCSQAICGNRAKQAAYRERHNGQAESGNVKKTKKVKTTAKKS